MMNIKAETDTTQDYLGVYLRYTRNTQLNRQYKYEAYVIEIMK